MTETTTFPFSALQDDANAEDSGDRRPFAVIVAGGLLAVALVGGAVFAFTGGEAELPVDSSVTRTGAAAATPETGTDLTDVLPVANTDSIARNPFEPKYVEPAPVVEAPLPDPTAGDAGVVPPLVVRDGQGVLVPVAPGVVSPAVPGSQPAPPAPPAPAPAPREHRLVLTGVTSEAGVHTAQFTIDGAVSSVKATEVFGPNQQLLLRSLQQGLAGGQWTATVQVGDARPIDVVVGQAVFVQ